VTQQKFALLLWRGHMASGSLCLSSRALLGSHISGGCFPDNCQQRGHWREALWCLIYMRLYRETGAALKETGATNYNALQSFLFPSHSLSIPFSLYLSLSLSNDDCHRGLEAKGVRSTNVRAHRGRSLSSTPHIKAGHLKTFHDTAGRPCSPTWSWLLLNSLI